MSLIFLLKLRKRLKGGLLMSKGLSYHYSGTKGHIVSVASSLPSNPNTLLSNGWIETTHPKQASNSSSRVFTEESTGLRIRFDKGDGNKNGYSGIDHYHIDNPQATGKKDRYIDKDGNVVPKNSSKSHILPNGGN